jgi:hypothetical protein
MKKGVDRINLPLYKGTSTRGAAPPNKETTMNYQIGQKVWVRNSWQDADCWTSGVVTKITAKRIKVDSDIRGEGFYSPQNVKKPS